MGIITEDPRPRVGASILSEPELVRPQLHPETGTTLVSGHQSVALEKRCLVYRSVHVGHKVVNVIPLRSIDSFCIRTFQIRPILGLALVLLVMSAAIGFWWYAVPLAKATLMENQSTSVSILELRVSAVLLAAAMVLLFVYLVFRRTELAVYTLSGKNSIHLPLSRRIASSAEAFVTEVEAQIECPTGAPQTIRESQLGF